MWETGSHAILSHNKLELLNTFTHLHEIDALLFELCTAKWGNTDEGI